MTKDHASAGSDGHVKSNSQTDDGDNSTTSSLKYKDAGVDIAAGNELVERIKPAVRRTMRPGVMGALGGFGGLFELPFDQYKSPVLVSGTDGVGTKLMLAIESGIHSTIGIDLVGMCVNDIIVTGAEPLFFLDYLATGKLSVTQGSEVIAGIADGCVQAGAALIGGETAEMPGMYAEGHYDLAGFAVGLVEKADIIDGSKVKPGDAIIGLASSGPHSNGYSLIRSILKHVDADFRAPFLGPDQNNGTEPSANSLGEALMAPTRIYVKSIQQVLTAGIEIKALAHITGGGLTENIPRVLPDGICAKLWEKNWYRPEIFNWLQRGGNVASDEMHRVFNCGIGMVAIVDPEHLDATLSEFNNAGEKAWHIGETVASNTSAADAQLSRVVIG